MKGNGLRAVRLLAPTILCLLQISGLAQEAKDALPETHRGAQYYLGQADELLMKINIWGFVTRPGQYMVPTDTDLISLISFAGGPTEQAKIKSIKIIRASTGEQRVSEADRRAAVGINERYVASTLATGNSPASETPAAVVLKVDVKKYLDTGDPHLIPPLRPGDTIVVGGSAFNTVRKVVDFATRLAILGQLYFWLNR